ncbi:uncharacterized protein EI90DRAFT_534875 [Cantharellus anzutake]|uniref:uncharacterized protein n=1 Tax=Cantharellus anzutake TaxID=1750568 RepID=UPI00190749B4|nr:uncharacterized protein EI90DRAFT_534875 [Cantharellus anzutake]KAF8334298.1 hypothetical protein EI90DRAFT_534875 [Cantharellus anzutake]
MYIISKSLAVLGLLSASLLSTSFAASADKIAETRAKFQELAASSPNGVIKLNSADFTAITSPGRDWSVALQLTALGKDLGCQPCQTFDLSFRAVAKAWSTVSKTARDSHFFASLDFADGQQVFRQVCKKKKTSF